LKPASKIFPQQSFSRGFEVSRRQGFHALRIFTPFLFFTRFEVSRSQDFHAVPLFTQSIFSRGSSFHAV
jgi:hypothetical protein